jgi:hypothetical protein
MLHSKALVFALLPLLVAASPFPNKADSKGAISAGASGDISSAAISSGPTFDVFATASASASATGALSTGGGRHRPSRTLRKQSPGQTDVPSAGSIAIQSAIPSTNSTLPNRPNRPNSDTPTASPTPAPNKFPTSPTPQNPQTPQNPKSPKNTHCPTCNPISGLNQCDPTTSCISTGSAFHCACRAGFKPADNSGFRLPLRNFEFLVFVPTGTACDALCKNPFGASGDICAEVGLEGTCPV